MQEITAGNAGGYFLQNHSEQGKTEIPQAEDKEQILSVFQGQMSMNC